MLYYMNVSKYTETWFYQIHDKYGGKRAWLRAHAYHLMDRFCLLPSGPNKAQLSELKRLVFVCHGNICRSPYSEARARQLGISSASFGLNADTGKRANLSAARVAKQRGLILYDHSATHISQFLFNRGDLVLTYEPQQLEELLSPGILPDFVTVVDLLGRWCTPSFPYIHDPYGLNDAYFNICFDRIDRSLARLVPLVPSSLMPHHEASNYSSR
jgi:protein-tyrosine phosphatase